MPKFRFNLEALLEQRRREERDRQGVVARLEGERREIEQRIARCQESISAGKREVRAHMVGVLDGAALRQIRQSGVSGMAMQMQAQQQAIRLAGVHKRLGAARADLLEAAKRRRAVERLREKRYEQWRLDQNRREAAQLDDIVNARRAGAGQREHEEAEA